MEVIYGKIDPIQRKYFHSVSLSLAKPFDESHTSAEVYIIVMCLGYFHCWLMPFMDKIQHDRWDII